LPVSGVGANPSTIRATFSIPASAASGTTITATISAFNVFVPAQETVVIPPNQRWYIYTITTAAGAVGPDGTVSILKNGDLQYFQPSLSQTSLSVLRGYTFPQPVQLLQNSTLSMLLTLTEANSSSAIVTQNVNLDTVKYAFALS